VAGTFFHTTINYSYSVSFSVYAVEDINYSNYSYSNHDTTKLLLYTVTSDTIPLPPVSTTSTTIQVVFPIHLPKQYNGCIQRSEFSVYQWESESVQKVKGGKNVGAPVITTPPPPPFLLGGEDNGSGKCQSFNVGQINGSYHMIFSQTGTTLFQTLVK